MHHARCIIILHDLIFTRELSIPDSDMTKEEEAKDQKKWKKIAD
jgi:hypothetical protein